MLLEEARKGAARTVNSVITLTYWEIGRRIVEHEQQGKAKPGYGDQVIQRLAADLTASAVPTILAEFGCSPAYPRHGLA